MESVAKAITQEECDAVASVYERILTSMRQNRIKNEYGIWKSLEAFCESKEPKLPSRFNMAMPSNWNFKQDNERTDQ